MALKWLKLPELDTKNVLQVVEENFDKVGLKTYAIRMIYIGEHTLNKEDFKKNIHKTIKAVNSGYVDVQLTGALLVYDSYFVHILEGSEDTVYRQLRFMFQREKDWIVEMDIQEAEEKAAAIAARKAWCLAEDIPYEPPPDEEPTDKPERKMFKRLKLLIVYHSITTILFNTYIMTSARPLSLVGTLDPYGPMAEHMEQLTICINKLKKLCCILNENPKVSFETMAANDPKMEALPEVALLDFLLASQHLYDLREISSMHRRVDDHMFYFEQVWPLPNAFTPRHLYKLKVDDSFVEPLPVMPWEIAREEEEKRQKAEAADEQRQSESDSD